jgi:hypothetical protein
VDRDDPGPYNYGDVVQLTANPELGWAFSDWSGDLSSSDNPKTITIDGNNSVTATFTQEEYTLTVNTVGNGSVTQDPLPPYYVGDDTVVTLTATADPGWSFSSWSDDGTGDAPGTRSVTMDGDKTVTATFTTSGGGGGGPTGGGAKPGVLTFTYLLDPEGRLRVPARANSEDGQAYLLLTPGTLCLRYDLPLAWIYIFPWDEAPPPTPEFMKVITRYFELGPEGSSFDPSIKLVFKYDPGLIPIGIDELDMVIMKWDEVLGEWTPLVTHVDLEEKIVWAELSGFSLYTVMVSVRPAEMSVSGITVSPGEISEGDSATVDAQVTNIGDFDGTYEAELKVNGSVVDTKVVEVNKRSSQSVSFELTGLEGGTYDVSIGEAVATLTVVAIPEPLPAAFSIDSLLISPEEVEIGENTEVSVRVENTGETEGVYTVACNVDGSIVEDKEISLAGGADTLVTFMLSFSEAGAREININGLTADVVVKEVVEEEPVQEGEIAEVRPEETPEDPSGTNWWMIGGILGACAVLIAAGIVIFRLRQRGY